MPGLPDSESDPILRDSGYSHSMPQIAWSYESVSSAATSSRLMYLVLRQWQRAHRLGFKVRNVLYRGRYLSAIELERCNLWLEAGGAAEAQRMEHWDAIKLFERVILRGDGAVKEAGKSD